MDRRYWKLITYDIHVDYPVRGIHTRHLSFPTPKSPFLRRISLIGTTRGGGGGYRTRSIIAELAVWTSIEFAWEFAWDFLKLLFLKLRRSGKSDQSPAKTLWDLNYVLVMMVLTSKPPCKWLRFNCWLHQLLLEYSCQWIIMEIPRSVTYRCLSILLNEKILQIFQRSLSTFPTQKPSKTIYVLYNYIASA